MAALSLPGANRSSAPRAYDLQPALWISRNLRDYRGFVNCRMAVLRLHQVDALSWTSLIAEQIFRFHSSLWPWSYATAPDRCVAGNYCIGGLSTSRVGCSFSAGGRHSRSVTAGAGDRRLNVQRPIEPRAQLGGDIISMSTNQGGMVDGGESVRRSRRLMNTLFSVCDQRSLHPGNDLGPTGAVEPFTCDRIFSPREVACSKDSILRAADVNLVRFTRTG